MGVAEVVGSAQEREAGSEQVRLICGRPPIRVAALELSSNEGEAFGEPASHMEAVRGRGGRRAGTG